MRGEMAAKIKCNWNGNQENSKTAGFVASELVDSVELAARLRVPPSWVRNRTRARTPRSERIPSLRLHRYVRFLWGSPELQEWLEKRRD